MIRRAVQASNEGGFGAFAEYLAPDAKWHAPPEYPDGEVWEGRDAIASAWTAQYDTVFDDTHTEITELILAPGGWCASVRVHAKAHGSDLEWQSFFLEHIENDLIKEVGVFNDRAQAHAAAGLDT